METWSRSEIEIADLCRTGDLLNEPPANAVERLFPFVLRARALLVGRENLQRSKRHLHFVLITTDLSEKSRTEIRATFAHYPIVQHYTCADLEKFFKVKGAKVVGFKKSGLAQSIYHELKSHRINQPVPSRPGPEIKSAKSAPPAEP